jgi:predicted ATPase
MLKEFTVNNFRLLLNVTFRPREINLIIGKNNCGKTTLVRALHFLATTSRASLDKSADIVAGSRIGLTNFGFSSALIDFHLKASVPFEDEELTFTYDLRMTAPKRQEVARNLEVEIEKLVVTGKKFDGVTLIENTRGSTRILHEADYLKGQATHIRMDTRRDATMLCHLFDMGVNARSIAFKNYLSSWQYFEFSSEALRGPEHDPFRRNLHADARNLASVLYHMKTSDELAYRKLLEHVKKIDDSIEAVNFQIGVEGYVFMYFTDVAGHSVSAGIISPGTLRFVAIACAMLSQKEKPEGSLITIEEPENGIFAGLLKEIVDMALQAPSRPQIIFTSHSPYFIDLFDTRLESVFFMRRDRYQSTIVQPDPAKIKKWLEHFPLGDQHYREMLV